MNRFVIAEPRLCIGCNTCMAACSIVHKAEGLQSLARLTVTRTAEGTAPMLCRQCEDSPCAKVCPVGAITHEGDAIVLNEATCIGCKLCAIACPFGSITPHGTSTAGVAGTIANLPSQPATRNPILAWEPGVRSVAVKCDLCSFSEQGPECVRVCPTRALYFVNDKALEQSGDAKRKAAVAALGDQPQLISAKEQE